MTWNLDFEAAFNPRAVAIAGASRNPNRGFDFVAVLQKAGFPGHIYPVNPKAAGGEIDGLKVYPNLVSVPEPIDLVIVSVPARIVPTVLEDCAAANAKNIHIFTAGFDETGEEEGIRLKQKLCEIAEREGLRIVGPNCMGITVPAAKLTTWEGAAIGSGPTSFLSQSGGHAGRFVSFASRLGLGVSKVISYGNAAVLDEVDFLEYLATDPETKVIGMYIEGTRDGKKLTSLVQEINRTKPVIVWKGGLTEYGARAVSSHTGSLGGQKEIWDAFYKQTRAIAVESLEELIDVVIAFLCLTPLPSHRMALMGIGGGNSVAGADTCTKEGLGLPILREETLTKLKSIIPPEGTSISNPFDIGLVMWDVNLLLQALEPIAADPSIDNIIFSLPLGLPPGASIRAQDMASLREASEKQVSAAIESLIKFAYENPYKKALTVVLQEGLRGELPGQRRQVQRELLSRGIPTYLSLERASCALGKFLEYHEFQRKANAG